MKRLVVDDLRVFGDFDATYARSLKMGMHLALNEPWDELYLDHDLGPKENVRPLVTELERRSLAGDPAPIGRIFIITGNPVAADWMQRALIDYAVRRLPFVQTDMISYTESLEAQWDEERSLEDAR